MSSLESDRRTENAFQALQSALEAIHPGEGERLLRQLRGRFLTAAAIFESGADFLEDAGLSAQDALIFSLIPALARYTGREEFGKSPRLNTAERAGAFLLTRFLGLHVEQFYLICLDANAKLIEAILLERGTTDRAPFYPRHVLQQAVRTRASYLIISHNHPNNSASPSSVDIRCTMELLEALSPLSIPLLDHLIVADKTVISLRTLGKPAPLYWNQPPHDCALLKAWHAGKAAWQTR